MWNCCVDLCAILLIRPNLNFVLAAFIFTIPLNLGIQFLIPGLNYFVREFLVIFLGLTISFVGSQVISILCIHYSLSKTITEKMGVGMGKFIDSQSFFIKHEILLKGLFPTF